MSSEREKTIFMSNNYLKVFASNYVDSGCVVGKKQFVKGLCLCEIMSTKTKNLLITFQLKKINTTKGPFVTGGI